MAKKADPPSKQEILVLRAVRQEGTVRAAALSLKLSTHTVDKHLDNLRRKTGQHHLTQLIGHAYEQGWMQDDLDLTPFTGRKRGPHVGWKEASSAGGGEQARTGTLLEDEFEEEPEP